jgi:hypothetical protein
MSYGWFFLAASVAIYGVGNLLQSVAATRVTVHTTLHPSLFLRLASHRVYLGGLACQIIGFVFAFVARGELPLFLVQASVAAGLGVTALLGVVVLHWRLPKAEVGILAAIAIGLAALVCSAERSPSEQLTNAETAGIGVAVVVIGVLGALAARLHGSTGSVALGSLAGLAFGAAAVASRPLASLPDWEAFLTHPLLYLVILHSAIGQLLIGLAMQRGSTTAAIASMDAAYAVPPAAIGLLLLGDRIAPGREWLAAAGFVVTLVAVIALTKYAKPQHAAPAPAVVPDLPQPEPVGRPAGRPFVPAALEPVRSGVGVLTADRSGRAVAHAHRAAGERRSSVRGRPVREFEVATADARREHAPVDARRARSKRRRRSLGYDLDTGTVGLGRYSA